MFFYHASGVNVDDADFNPVTKVPVIISGDEGTVFIEVVDEVSRAELGQIGGGGGSGAAGEGICEQLLALQSRMSQICHDIHDIKMNQGVDKSMVLKQVCTEWKCQADWKSAGANASGGRQH